MISIPPYLLLLPFGAFLLGFLFFSLANIIGLAKYGARNTIGFLAAFIFVSGAAIILFLTWQALAATPWTTPVPVFTIQTPSL